MTARAANGLMIAAALVLPLTLGACARQISPAVHTGPAVGETVETYIVTVENARPVSVQESDTLEGNRTGIALGGLAGGAAASRFGGGWGKVLAIAGGAIAGAAVGAVAEQEIKRQSAIEYVVRTDDGRLFTVVQGPDPAYARGQRLYLQTGGQGRGRLVPATG